MQILPFPPYGYCSGVANAFALARKAREEHPRETIYLVGSLVHNEAGMKPLLEDGFVLLDEANGPLEKQMEGLKEGSIVLFSAHGHSEKAYRKVVDEKRFTIYDATCPFVQRNIDIVLEGKKTAFIGNPNHLEAIAIHDEPNVSIIDPSHPVVEGKFDRFLVQTSLDEEEMEKAEALLKEKNPNIENCLGRCPSSILRQKNVIAAPKDVDLIIVVGSRSSANSKRLASLAKKTHPSATVWQVLDEKELAGKDLSPYQKAALFSGASSSEAAFQAVCDDLMKI